MIGGAAGRLGRGDDDGQDDLMSLSSLDLGIRRPRIRERNEYFDDDDDDDDDAVMDPMWKIKKLIKG